MSKYVNKYKSRSRIERDTTTLINTPVEVTNTIGSVIDVVSQDGRSIGDIIVAVKNADGTFSNTVASPMSPHFISLPLPNERVSLMKDGTSSKWYYLTSLSRDGFVNHMANGIKRVFEQDTSDLYMGKVFTPSPALRSLNIHEGDTVIQGRSGQSIRFGSKRANTNTPWNADSDEGLPVITIRSGVSQLENLNTDFSSIYLTSGQAIPIQLKSNIPPLYISPELYSDNQIIITSDRLTMYSQDDSIILSSAKDVSISTDTWAIDVNTLIEQVSDLCAHTVALADKLNKIGLYAATSTHISGAPGAPTAVSLNAPQFQQVSTEAGSIKAQLQTITNIIDDMKH